MLPRICIFVAVTSCVGCGHKAAPAAQPAADRSPTVQAEIVRTQTVPPSPCAWLSQADAEKILGAELTRAPLRVLSIENPRPADVGEACLYEIHGEYPKTVSIQVIADESGAMQTALAGMGNVEKEFRGPAPDAASPWDYVGAMPGGLTALRRGRIAVQMVASMAMSDKGYALATSILARITDLPFVTNPDDVRVLGQGPNPCRFLTGAEAEAALGPLIVAPYRSRKATALAYGSGGSCSYFSGKHRALVVTPKESHGAQLFAMLGGSEAKIAGLLHSPKSTGGLTGEWDRISVGTDGTLHALKNDKMLSVQFITSPADLDAAARLVGIALARF
jgi:hypothetical protein